jgi:aminomethyltransferase
MKTPLHDTHAKLGARIAPFGGWDMPIQYEGILAEHEQTRARASIFDICHMGEFELRGPTAERDLEKLLTQNIATIKQGQARYGYLLNDSGGVIDDLTCYRLGPEYFYLVVNAGTRPGDAAWIKSHLSPQTQFRDVSDETAKLDIQGPASREEIEKVLGAKLPDLKYFFSAECEMLGTKTLLSRTGYTGEWGYEIYFPWNDAIRFWNAFTASGAIKPAGLGARDTLRLEVAYPLYGHELGPERTPIAASRGMFVDMNKDFIGKAACARDLAGGCPRYLAGLKLESKRAARAHDKVLCNSKEAGEITSGSLAPSLGIAIALAYVDSTLCAPGTKLEIAVAGGKTLPATVVELPFYKNGTARRK